MLRARSLLLVGLIFTTLTTLPAVAQKRRGGSNRRPPTEATAAKAAHDKAKEDLKKATEDYKQSLRELLALRETAAKRADAELGKVEELYKDGLISKHDLELRQEEVNNEKARVTEVRLQLTKADQTLAETLAEAEAAEQLANVRAPKGSLYQTTAYFRYYGATAWSLSSMAGQVQNFFYSKFKHALPVSAFGQSELHNRWRYDHSNAMDVGLSPDSAEGQALIAYLQSRGIPFMAFRRAVPGSASGPHIHIGQPSRKF